MESYKSIQEAALANLHNVCTVLNSNLGGFIVVGGWVPFLTIEDPTLDHPGTLDVDLLFQSTSKCVENCVLSLLEDGYIQTAKHSFQLVKNFSVNDTSFAYSVDLLHPSNRGSQKSLFENVFNTKVPDLSDPTGFKHVTSIAFPLSDIIFENNMHETIEMDFKGSSFRVPLMNASGCVISKFISAKNIKRKRDIFDIFTS